MCKLVTDILSRTTITTFTTYAFFSLSLAFKTVIELPARKYANRVALQDDNTVHSHIVSAFRMDNLDFINSLMLQNYTNHYYCVYSMAQD